MKDCLFCKISSGEILSKKVYEDNELFAFEDINPQAPIHILIIPKEHISTTNDLNDSNYTITGKLTKVAVNIAKDKDLESYRLVMNCNEDAGQSVFHIHLHLLGGRIMHWPPG
jgi:histidine triad (HIT) family protein